MPIATVASRRARSRAGASALALRVFEQRDLVTPILRMVASPNGLLVTKHVARDARAVVMALRKLVWQDRILKGTAIHKGHTSRVECCAFSPDGKRIVTGSNDKTAQLWDAETGARRSQGSSSDARCRPQSHAPQIAIQRICRLFGSSATGAVLMTLEVHTGGVMSCAFSPDGKRLVTASHDTTARLWDAETGALLTTLREHTGSVFCCAFSPDGKRIVTASRDKTARLWDAETGALVATLEGHTSYVYSCAFSPDGKRIVTASGDKTARLWNDAL
ncbi:WD40-repeat-containing domain protein [Pelagophyceae sp. CCMP2097]|nr:WD40-repeat-containing domain protein [Pelagophyceae sp. CCMP2097]